MKFCLKITIFIFILTLLYQSSFALNIVSPKEGQIFYAGSHLDVVVKPDVGEKWTKVILGIFPMTYNTSSNEYRDTIEIPPDELGTISISVLAADQNGKEIELQRNITSKLPPNVVLKSILLNKDFMLLYMPPAGSSPTDYQQFFLSKQISVGGLYSDGVERDLTSSSNGTTYASSDQNVVTVDKEGKVTAQGIGTAKIIVRNGKYSAEVDVDVERYRAPEK